MANERPRDLSPGQLGFERRPPVPWLSPPLLAATGIRVVLAELFGAYLDKRELQAVMAGAEYRFDEEDELWIDYVADAGDGFDATYTIAYLVAQPTVTVDRADGSTFDLPRGRVLVLGGDEVYPVASAREYETRWKGPYRAALPADSGDPPTIYALPGNHDWYDGLTAFLRIFGQGDPIGGWRTQQARSYFALALPHGWWLFAIDAQFDAYLDEPQLRYFRGAASRLRPADRVILCAARPTWVIADRVPDAARLEYIEIGTLLRQRGGQLAPAVVHREADDRNALRVPRSRKTGVALERRPRGRLVAPGRQLDEIHGCQPSAVGCFCGWQVVVLTQRVSHSLVSPCPTWRGRT